VYALTLLAAIVQSVDNPTRQALVPSLVPRSALANAIALNSLLWKSTILVGPSLAGIAISTVGTDGAFYANALSFLAVVVALFFMKGSSSGNVSAGGFVPPGREWLAGDLIRSLLHERGNGLVVHGPVVTEVDAAATARFERATTLSRASGARG